MTAPLTFRDRAVTFSGKTQRFFESERGRCGHDRTLQESVFQTWPPWGPLVYPNRGARTVSRRGQRITMASCRKTVDLAMSVME